MKQYYTIDYDLNRPSNRIVSAPLNSDFGVGVRMWRNGSALDSDITVGGNASTGTRGGYQLFDLSTGSDETMTDYQVSGESKFNLRVYETDKNYIEKWGGGTPPEPPSPWDVVSGSKTFVAEATTTETIYSEDPVGELGWIYAKQVKSFTCTYSDNGGQKQTISGFMNVQVQDDAGEAYFFCHAGDPSNGNIWYESEGGMGAERPQIKVAGNFRTIHFPVVEGHTYEIEWKLEYDADMVFEELSSSGPNEVTEGEQEITQFIFNDTPPEEPLVLSAGQVAEFLADSTGSGQVYLTDGPYIYDINGNTQYWTGNKWYDYENYSDYIEIGPESQFGAYFEYSMSGEYTTTFNLKYANE